VIWLAGAAAVTCHVSSVSWRNENQRNKNQTVGLLGVALPWWLVGREEARWQRFRAAHGEPEVFAEKLALKGDRAKQLLVALKVVGSSADR
jgi:hypothetical protein